jgi:hypothetical protein
MYYAMLHIAACTFQNSVVISKVEISEVKRENFNVKGQWPWQNCKYCASQNVHAMVIVSEA